MPILKSLYITDTKLPNLEELFSLWDEGYEVWVVNEELAKQLKAHWALLQDEPHSIACKMSPILVVVKM